jgi:protein O-mannosyl-transferase
MGWKTGQAYQKAVIPAKSLLFFPLRRPYTRRMFMDSSSLPRLPRKGALLGIVALFTAIMLVVYGKSLGNGFVRWDDGLLIYENPAVMEMTPGSLKRIFTTYDPELYIPLTLLSYQIDYQLGNGQPFLFHLENWFWHLLNGLFVAWLAYLLMKRKWIAVLTGLLFLLHPLHTEAVAWASGRKDVLSMFFFLATVIGYLYHRQNGSTLARRLSIIAFTLGLMSKGQILVLPAVLILLDLFRGQKFSKQMFTEKWPYFLLSIIFGAIGIYGKLRVAGASSLYEKVVMSFKSTMFYLEKLFWPDHFSLLYPYNESVTLASPDFYVPMVIVLVIVALCVLLWKKLPELWFGFAFYYLVLAPTFLNFAKGEDMGVYFASDRYPYVASVGVFLFIGLLITRMVRNASESKEQLTAGALSLLVVAPLGVLAYNQSMVWENTQTLFANVIQHYPESSHVAHNNLGNMYRLGKDLDRAIDEYNQALAIKPHAKTYANLGAAYRQQKKYTEAMTAYQKGITLTPGSKEAHFGLGIVYAELGQREKATEEYRKALTIDPKYEEAYTNLGSVLLAERKVDEAITQYQKALEVNKFFPDAQYNLAVALDAKGDIDGAIDAYIRAASLAPYSTAPLINLGILYAKKGDREASIRAFERVLRIDPNHKTAREALRQLGQ